MNGTAETDKEQVPSYGIIRKTIGGILILTEYRRIKEYATESRKTFQPVLKEYSSGGWIMKENENRTRSILE